MRVAFPGSFDPVTNGHVDVIEQASYLFDSVVVAIGTNATKRDTYLFSADERLMLVERAVAHLGNVTVELVDGLVATWCEERGIRCLVKGLRSCSDLEGEVVQARVNGELFGVRTVYVPASARWSHVSSSVVKELASYGADTSAYVPQDVAGRLRAHWSTTGKMES